MSRSSREFEEILRAYLPDDNGDDVIDPDAPFSESGVNSLALVGLMIELESQLYFSFPEHLVNPTTFYSAGSLWSVVSQYATSPDE